MHRGASRQDWGTPPEFLAAVEARFGVIDFDLAASHQNSVADRFFSEQENSLVQDWTLPHVGIAWCNPPFADIRPWAAKCESVRNLPRWTLLLVPASMGSLWWRDHVIGKCQADGIPRIKFVGASEMYPKDLACLCYGFGVAGHGFWDWRAACPKQP